MDPIDFGEGSNAQGTPPDPGTGASSSRPALTVLQPSPQAQAQGQNQRSYGPSNRQRRPSIRLTRLNSSSSLETSNSQQAAPEAPTALPPLQREVSVKSPVEEEDESQVTGRRRSSSEPRPGRWATSPDVLSRTSTPMRMSTVAEATSTQSPAVRTTQPQGEANTQQNETMDDLAAEALDVPPAALQRPGSRSRLRRTSQAALRPFTRNRASTVTGASPGLPVTQQKGPGEYGSHVVDVLDVIGRHYFFLRTARNNPLIKQI